MRRFLLSVVALLAVVVAQGKDIIPQPCKYEVWGGECALSGWESIYYGSQELQPVAEYLSAHLGMCISDKGGKVALMVDGELEDEAYRIDVMPHGVTIYGGDYGGVFNGVATLLQLLPSEVYGREVEYPIYVSCCQIEDAPRYGHRGFMLDVCRTWMDKEAVKNFIDILAYHKINNLRLHLTDDEAWRLEIKSHPELAEMGGFRGGDSPIWPRYGKWLERWGGYYTQEDMREIIEYARVRNIEIIPEIDLPGHSLCIATLHPEILCNYTPDTSAALGYDTRSAFCASREENYAMLEDILAEVCDIFTSEYIHIGGDEVDMSQWRKCHDCQRLMSEHNMDSTAELQRYFMSRVADIVARHGHKAAVWNEAIDGGSLTADVRVYGWESVAECRKAAAEGYPTVVMPGEYFYFDMKQSLREPGHDWAAIFDWRKLHSFTLESVGFTAEEQMSVIGFEGSFFSELYASHAPETADYLHYQTFPRMLLLSELAWSGGVQQAEDAYYATMVKHYARLDAMGVAYRLMPPRVEYREGKLYVVADDGSEIYFRRELSGEEEKYIEPIATKSPAEYSFVARRGRASSMVVGVEEHFRTITPAFTIYSSMADRERFSYVKAQGYGRLARTARAADVGDWVEFRFEQPVACRRMKVATGNFQLPRYIFESGYVEVSYDGMTYHRVGELECGVYMIENPAEAIKAVRITCTRRGNGAEWVSIQPPIIWPLL